jgi:penicillin-binding protein 1A
VRQSGDRFEITGEGLRPAQSGLSDKAPPKIKIRRGAVIRAMKTPKDTWEITQLPEVGRRVHRRSIRATAASTRWWAASTSTRTSSTTHPGLAPAGLSFKPFIYSAALEKGFTPATIVNDARCSSTPASPAASPGSRRTTTASSKGPMPLHTALAKSKNMVSIRVLQAVGTQNAQDWITRFGFEAEKHPAYLTMALGAGSVTPMQMATAYSVFANGGYRVNPWLVTQDHRPEGQDAGGKPAAAAERIGARDRRAQLLHHEPPAAGSRAAGTAARAQATLKRVDCTARPAPPTTRSTPGSTASTRRCAAWSGWATTRRARWATAKPAAA